MAVLSDFQAKKLLNGPGQGRNLISCSLDFGLAEGPVPLDWEGITLGDGQFYIWSEIEMIVADPNAFFFGLRFECAEDLLLLGVSRSDIFFDFAGKRAGDAATRYTNAQDRRC